MATKRGKGEPKAGRKLPAPDWDKGLELELSLRANKIRQSRVHVKRELERMRIQFEAGNRKALFSAIRLCALQDIRMPEWVAVAFVRGHEKVHNYEVGSLDEAFGPPFPKGTHILRRRQHLLKLVPVWQEVSEELERGSSINRELFERVGRKLGLGKSRVEELFYSMRRVFGDMRADPTRK